MTRRLLLIGATVGLMAVLLFQPATALIGRNTFNPDAYLHNNGRMIWVTAQISCTEGERVTVEATVTQEHTGALARGYGDAVCEDLDLEDEDQFQEILIRAVARGSKNRFEPGNVVAAGVALTRDNGEVTATRQWMPDDGIELVPAD